MTAFERISDQPGDIDRRAATDGEPAVAAAPVLDARLLPAALSCWGATIVALTVGWTAGLVLAAALVLLAIGLWVVLLRAVAHPSERWRVVAVAALAALLLGAGFALAGAWREHRVATHPLRNTAASVRVVVVPIDDPKPVRSSAFGNEQRWTVRARLREYRQGASIVRAGGTVVILASGAEWGELLPGRAVELRAEPEPPWHRDLTVATLRAQGSPVVVGALPWWQRVAAAVRTDLASAARVLPKRQAGLLPALVVGDTSALSDEVREEFEIAGLAHICVVSGANFTILSAVVLGALRLLTVGPRAGAVVAAAALLMFIVVARPDPSVLRAGAMGAITLLALLTGRRKQALPALCAAVIGLLALWPELAVRAGFGLSVLATAGLILLAPSWADWLRGRGWWRVPAEIVAVSAAAFVVTTPLVVALTGRLSLVAILANILVEPVIAPVTVLGAIGTVLAAAWPPLAELILRCAQPPLWWLLLVAEHAASVPGAEISVRGGLTGGAIACAAVVLIVLALRSALMRRLAAAALLGVSAVLIPVRVWHPGWPPAGWVLAVCDVGQGDGLVLSVDGHTAVVIDVGPDPRTMRTCLNRLRINRISLLVLTHPHADHIAGLAGALRGRSVDALAVGPGELSGTTGNVESGRAGDRRTSNPKRSEADSGESTGASREPRSPRNRRASVSGPEQVASLAAQADIPVQELSSGQVLRFGAVELNVLAPTPLAHHPTGTPSTDDANDRSIVIAATTSAGRILFTGDIEAPAQQQLLHSGAHLQADVLKLPHHGSRTTTKEFIAAVHPRLALVSVGADNTFGHPNPRVLTDLADLGVAVARTDQQGDVLVLGKDGQLRTLTVRPTRPSSR
ncbi:ComEC/Rec2 family competence protein [Nocardia sp. NPDC051990]|uniref:ComEC/Rec2 family competence protein n=1 Tax=Nocardia sp. NPDC051990 TaxID=3155285 RepID=UPI00342FABFB